MVIAPCLFVYADGGGHRFSNATVRVSMLFDPPRLGTMRVTRRLLIGTYASPNPHPIPYGKHSLGMVCLFAIESVGDSKLGI